VYRINRVFVCDSTALSLPPFREGDQEPSAQIDSLKNRAIPPGMIMSEKGGQREKGMTDKPTHS